MRKQSNYRMVSNAIVNGAIFSEQVNKMLDAGYIVTGGLQVSDGKLYQAMVIERDEVDISGLAAEKVTKKEKV